MISKGVSNAPKKLPFQLIFFRCKRMWRKVVLFINPTFTRHTNQYPSSLP